MPKTLTLTVGGDLSVAVYAKVLDYLSNLVEDLTEELVGEDTIEWKIASLAGGSATTTLIGRPLNGLHRETGPALVIEGWRQLGFAIQRGEDIPFSWGVQHNASGLVSLINGEVNQVVFASDDFSIVVDKTVDEIQDEGIDVPKRSYDLGVLRGHVGTIWELPRPKFALYDELFGLAVHCYPDDTDYERLRSIWLKRVEVTGLIERDLDDGRPVKVREVQDITVVEEPEQSSFHKARGLFEWKEGDEPAELAIRRLRDGL